MQITALEIQALKRVSKGSTIILLDKSGNTAKSVAQELCKLGFNSVYTVTGGFSGWIASKLQIRAPVRFLASVAVLSEMLFRSPRKVFSFFIKKCICRITVSKQNDNFTLKITSPLLTCDVSFYNSTASTWALEQCFCFQIYINNFLDNFIHKRFVG